ALAPQQPRELGGGRRLARALEAREQDRVAERLLDSLAAEQLCQLLVHDLHDLLRRRQALEDLLAERPLAHARRELPTTSRLTSASRRARRISRSAREIDSSSSVPRLRRSPRAAPRRSERASNTGRPVYARSASGRPGQPWPHGERVLAIDFVTERT